MQEAVTVREGDKLTKMSAPKALAKSIYRDGLKGNARSAGLFFDQMRSAAAVHAAEMRETQEFWARYKAIYGPVFEEAERSDAKDPEVLPHPDDVVIDDDVGVRFVGPIDQEGQRRMNDTITLRDLLIMQDVLDQRSPVMLGGAPLEDPGGALLYAMAIECGLPIRLRFTTEQYGRLNRTYQRMSKRELLKELHQRWRRIGHPKQRGFVFPGIAATRQKLGFVHAFHKAATEGEIDIDAISRGEFDDNFLAFLAKNGRSIASPQDRVRPASSSAL